MKEIIKQKLDESADLKRKIGLELSEFERQLQNLATDKDVVIGLSTSGNSMNVIRGIEQAKKNKSFTIALTGNDGGKIKDVADLSIIVPSDNTARIQEAHITIGHILCHLIEKNLFGLR